MMSDEQLLEHIRKEKARSDAWWSNHLKVSRRLDIAAWCLTVVAAVTWLIALVVLTGRAP